MATQPTLVLSTPELASANECTPNLMPFHIKYNGPAPVDTYLRIETVKRGVGMPSAGTESEVGKGEKKDDTDKDVVMEANPDGQTLRYVSAFRGRELHGIDVTLPAGYAGVVLRSAGEVSVMSENEDEDGEPRTEKILKSSNVFSTLRVWHPDYAVDGGRDEYVRGLAEWTGLCEEIHRTESEE